ncbi:F-box/LRR-repeat protein At3g59200-like [Durio zibethinus]|uniref:F-box/LRR-repeat protein At3g59200-like n=1 Tax=Durio zibethinus TaxID=66656 RepID=A0A6P5ZGT4_DURZI|nr:F-box/LRR-repeat protein At3g59200-like [Durio zibethinus]
MAKQVKSKYDKCWISDLPYVVLCRILSFLPTEEAVRTSILSTRWRYLFSEDDRRVNSFMNFVDRVLFFHKVTRIERFRLRCSHGVDSSRVWLDICCIVAQQIYSRIYLEKVPYCLLSQLKKIEMCSFRGEEDEMELIKYFLKSARVLEKLIVYLKVELETEELKITTELFKLPRGSSKCQVQII